MNPFVEDNVPFRKRVRNIADTIEKKRQEFNEGRKKSGIGTFSNLEELIKQRKEGAKNASSNRY